MLDHLLQAAMNAQPYPSVIYVQQAAGGMPEWVRIIISAAVGGSVAVVTNTVMEFIKPRLVKSAELKKAINQISSELEENLDQVETLRRMTIRANVGGREDRKQALNFAREILATVANDRYLSDFENQKALVYEIDPRKKLQGFYAAINRARSEADGSNYASLLNYLRIASEHGRALLAAHGVQYWDTPDAFYDAMIPPSGMEDNPESWYHECSKSGAFKPKD